MSPHELQQKLLEYYTLHYKVVEGMEDELAIDKYLVANHLDYGVCNVIEKVFNKSDDDCNWTMGIVDKRGRQLFWCDIPMFDYGKEQMLTALSTRIQILTELVKQ